MDRLLVPLIPAVAVLILSLLNGGFGFIPSLVIAAVIGGVAAYAWMSDNWD